ncbi:scarecrow-like protein 15 [Ricinus communis]|uniref:DELLA protein GAIP-B, putative n=1 Tax=Ricinus communis TaxID=3988 RepID=B9SGI9_RICCO|nr:scarecrow-like protein 15 [Ricinus communis]EEF37235.1 DELLA protein GAIP-B, putative [Ricinus communis]|eukprot:XP_002525108.1 scarecrow-like protein 15 [Ricinus communis]
MKVPVSSSQNNNHRQSQSANLKNSTNSRNIGFHNSSSAPNLCYEPTSVLDLRRSPSPVSGKPASGPEHHHSLEWDEHVLQNFDWDFIMKELDFHEDSTPTLKNIPQVNSCESIIHSHNNLQEFTAPSNNDPPHLLHHPDFNDICFNIPTQKLNSLDLSHNIGNWSNFGFDLIQELIRAADCIDSSEIQLANVILDRLNHRLQSPVGKPLQRAAFFFKEALQNLLAGSPRTPTHPTSWSEVVQTIKAYQDFSGISPIPMFNHFPVDQAILETLDDSPPFIHVIDFDIGLGCQYASFMRELVGKTDHFCNKLTSPVLRITAVVTEDYAIQTQLIKQCLSQYALELKIRFQIEFVLTRTFEMVSFKSIKFIEGEKIAILLSSATFRRLGSSNNNINSFVTDIRRVSPEVVVVVDNEGWGESEPASFRRNFVNGLEFYSMIFESLDAAAAGGGEWARKIEMFLLKPRIFAAVEGCGRRVSPPWREVFCGAGMRVMPFSQFSDFQAESLLGKVQVRGFYVAKRQAELVLCWHERPLIATSVWKC